MVHLWIWIQESIVMKHEHTQQTMPKHTTDVHVPIRREKKDKSPKFSWNRQNGTSETHPPYDWTSTHKKFQFWTHLKQKAWYLLQLNQKPNFHPLLDENPNQTHNLDTHSDDYKHMNKRNEEYSFGEGTTYVDCRIGVGWQCSCSDPLAAISTLQWQRGRSVCEIVTVKHQLCTREGRRTDDIRWWQGRRNGSEKRERDTFKLMWGVFNEAVGFYGRWRGICGRWTVIIPSQMPIPSIIAFTIHAREK